MQQFANRVDGHDVGSAKSTREEASRGACAGPEIKDPARANANAVETLEQGIACDLREPGELGVPIAGPARTCVAPQCGRMSTVSIAESKVAPP